MFSERILVESLKRRIYTANWEIKKLKDRTLEEIDIHDFKRFQELKAIVKYAEELLADFENGEFQE